MKKITKLISVIGFILCLSACQEIREVSYEQLRGGFTNLPDSIQTSVYWHWISGNISKEGVIKDLESMKQAGINRAFIANIGLSAAEAPIGDVHAATERCPPAACASPRRAPAGASYSIPALSWRGLPLRDQERSRISLTLVYYIARRNATAPEDAFLPGEFLTGFFSQDIINSNTAKFCRMGETYENQDHVRQYLRSLAGASARE